MKNTLHALLVILCVMFCTQDIHAQQQQPNILVIMADDLGFSDLSSYGGEIPTPAIDSLATNGVRFNKFYVSPMCVTSRVAFLSGMEYMAAGKNNFPNSESIAVKMRENGYTTSLVGKNHGMGTLKIGSRQTDYGFDHFYGFTGGQINSFTGAGNVKWQDDGTNFPHKNLPEDFYATKNFTDRSISYMRDAIQTNQPFFSILAYNAPHSPLDAPERNVRKFYDPKNGINAYKKGWNKMREERYERMLEMGIIPEDAKLSALGPEIPDWDSLPKKSNRPWEMQQDFEALSRSAYAGMVDNIDENVGRIIDFLKDPNQDGNTKDSKFENTIIIFISDNGGCYAGSYTPRKLRPWNPKGRGGFTTNYGWAALSNTPFSSYKHGSGEGAIRSPMIIHWPAGLKLEKNSINDTMLRIWDLYPTFMEIAGAKPHKERQLMGKSFAPLLRDQDFEEEQFFVSTFYRSKGIIKENWKLVSYFDSPFELYNLENDPSETIDLRAQHPKKFKELLNSWNAYTRKAGFENDKRWNMATGDKKRNFGYDRINKLLKSTTPEYMEDNVAVSEKLVLDFKGPVTFKGTQGKSIRLLKYGNPAVLWSKDLDENSSFEGKTILSFEDFPQLDPGSHYYITWDPGWVKVKQNGKFQPITPVRESAYAYRFKTSNNTD
ncbi:MAG: sulfatase-like hydrolase/transferase [Nonlabens sp.]